MSTPERVAVVTGAAAGLGQAYAIRLGRAGFRLALLDLGASDETSTILEGMGVTAHSWACDVSDWDSVESVSKSVVDYFGRSDVLINNAGIYPSSKFDDISPADWRKMMAVNLDGTFYMCRAFVPHMRAKKYGRIVNLSSNAGWINMVGSTAYIASKMGVVGITRGLAAEVGTDGITVNCVAPGMVSTPGTASDGHQRWFAKLAKRQAIDRVGEVDDITGAVAFLASDDAGYITGQTILVDGGLARN